MTDQPTGGIQIDGAINYHSLLFISMTVDEAETTLTAELISCLRHNEALVRGAFGNNVTYSVTRDGITIGALTLLPDYIPGITTPVMWTHRTACERAIEQYGRTRDHWPAADCAQIDRFEIILDRVMSNLVALSEERRDQMGTAQAGTDPDALQDKPADKSGSGKVVTGGVASSIAVGTLSKNVLAKETAADKAARLKREAEERQEREAADRKERLAHWKVCGLKRKAQADSNWLILNTAKTLAPKVPLSGMWLEVFANHIEDEYIEYEGSAIRLDQINTALGKQLKAIDREALLREKVLLHLICDAGPDESDWPGVKKHVTEFITGAPGKNGAGGLGFKFTLTEPPLHHTATNCWTCGTFAPYDEIAKAQIEEGWIVVQGGKGSEPTNVTCPTCAQKSATRPAPKPSAKKTGKK